MEKGVLEWWSESVASKSKAIVMFVRSDPEPIIIAISFAGQCSVAAANLRRINAPFFLKANRGMVWVGLEESEFFVSEFLNVLRQRVIALPKGRKRPRSHGNGVKLPASI